MRRTIRRWTGRARPPPRAQQRTSGALDFRARLRCHDGHLPPDRAGDPAAARRQAGAGAAGSQRRGKRGHHAAHSAARHRPGEGARPAAAEEYARRLAQRGVPIAALLRAYRIGSARFEDWCLKELGRQTDNASIVSAAGLRIAGDHGLLHRPGVRRGRVRLRVGEGELAQEPERGPGGARPRLAEETSRWTWSSSEAMLGYRLRQHHLGVVTWITGASGGGDALGRLEQVTCEVAAEAHCEGRPIFIPQDEFSRVGLAARSAPGATPLSAAQRQGRPDCAGRPRSGSLSVSLRWDCRVSAEPISRR